MFTLQDKDGQPIEASMHLYKTPTGHTVRLRVFGQQLPPIIQTLEDGSTQEIDGGKESLLFLGGGAEFDALEQAFEAAVADALNTLLAVKGI
jgi:hypothetical protein